MVIRNNNPNPDVIGVLFAAVLILYSFPYTIISIDKVYGQANVVVTPTCGPSSGFGITFNATGFSPNGLVHWKLIHSNGSEAPNQFGSFETDRNGNFSEPTYIGEGLSPDVYTVYFFDDLDNDATRDPAGAESSSDASIPCR